LQLLQRRQEGLERPPGQRRVHRLRFTFGEGLQATGLVDALCLVGEQHRIAIECELEPVLLALADGGRKDGGCRDAQLQRMTYVATIGGQEQVTVEGRNIAVRTVATAEG